MGNRLRGSLAMHVVLRQRFDGGKFPQSEPPATTPALHPLSGVSPSLRFLHSKSSLQPASLFQGDAWYRVDTFPYILVGDPGLQLLVNDESPCFLDGRMQSPVRFIQMRVRVLRGLVCADPPSVEFCFHIHPSCGGGRLAFMFRLQEDHGGSRLAMVHRREYSRRAPLTCSHLQSASKTGLSAKPLEVLCHAPHVFV